MEPVYATDAIMDVIESIRRRPEAERTESERATLEYADAHRFTRYDKLPDLEPLDRLLLQGMIDKHGRG